MESANLLDTDGELVEERIVTHVRGVQFTLSASIINTILQIANPPPVSTPDYGNREIFTTLRPNEEFPADQMYTLTFTPGTMPPLNRVLWYIYSRNFIQKGGSYTHFSKKDYRFFTAFVKKHPLNLGHWIFQEILKFRFSSRHKSYIPYPSLMSVILFYHKIWYVGPPELMKYPPMFGKAQLNLMKINFEGEASGQSRAPSRSQAGPSQSRAQEAHSRPSQAHPSPQPSIPTNLDSRLKGIVDAAIASLSIRMEFEIGRLLNEVKLSNHAMVDAQDAMKAQVETVIGQNQALKQQVTDLQNKQDEIYDQLIDLDARVATHSVTTCDISTRVDRIINLLHPGSTSTFGTTSPPVKPEPSPSFDFQTPPPSPPEASTPVFPSSPVPTSTPSTEILPSPVPSTALVVYSPPPTPYLQLLRAPSPSLFEDAKGGEKGQED